MKTDVQMTSHPEGVLEPREAIIRAWARHSCPGVETLLPDGMFRVYERATADLDWFLAHGLTFASPPPADREADRELTDNDIRRIWREAGGSFYGPNVEHADIEESKLFTFFRKPAVRAALSRLMGQG